MERVVDGEHAEHGEVGSGIDGGAHPMRSVVLALLCVGGLGGLSEAFGRLVGG